MNESRPTQDATPKMESSFAISNLKFFQDAAKQEALEGIMKIPDCKVHLESAAKDTNGSTGFNTITLSVQRKGNPFDLCNLTLQLKEGSWGVEGMHIYNQNLQPQAGTLVEGGYVSIAAENLEEAIRSGNAEAIARRQAELTFIQHTETLLQ